jgi:AcrR family transcriptional regulator
VEAGNRRSRAERTRQSLLEAAREVFESRGYQATSVAAITEAASTSHGTFYLYFRNKEDIFVEIASAVWDEVYRSAYGDRTADDVPFTPEAMRDSIRATIEAYLRYRRFWRALLEGALASPVIESAWVEYRHGISAELAGHLRDTLVAADGHDLDAGVAAESLMSMVEWFAIHRLSFDVGTPLAADDATVDTIVALWANALGILVDA